MRSSPPEKQTNWIKISVFSVSFLALYYEILLFRLFSAHQSYGPRNLILAFGLASFSLGSLIPRRLSILKGHSGLIYLVILFSISLWLTFLAHRFHWLLFSLLSPFPLLFSGSLLSDLLLRAPPKAVPYSFGILGSAAGSMSCFLLLNWGGHSVAILFLLCAAAAFSSMICASLAYTAKLIFFAGAAFVVGISALKNGGDLSFDPPCVLRKSILLKNPPKSSRTQSLSNSNSYIEVHETAPGWWKAFIDCRSSTDIVNMQQIPPPLLARLKERKAQIFSLRKFESALILGSGGGVDVALANHYGAAKKITAVERNSLLLELERSLIPRNESAYGFSNVTYHQQEARRFLSATNETFDLIYLGYVAYPTGAGSNEFLFLPNFTATKEAFHSFFDHLQPNGTLFVADRPTYALAYVKTLKKVLEERFPGVRDNLLIYQNESYLSQLSIFAKDRAFTVPELELYANFGKRIEIENFLGAKDFSDDRPFPWAAIQDIHESKIVPPLELNKGHLRKKLSSALCLSLLALMASVWGWPQIRSKESSPRLSSGLYFSAIGFGFSVIQITLTQILAQYFSRETFALILVVSGMLVFSGIASRIAESAVVKQKSLILLSLVGALILTTQIQLQLLSWLGPTLMKQSDLANAIQLLCLIGLSSLCIGSFFSMGLQHLSTEPAHLDYYLCLNGLGATLGGAMAGIMASNFGLSGSLTLGSLVYLGTLPAILKSRS